LKNDPQFPPRLNAALEEVQAYWFYKQKMWDSSAAHLTLALDQATNRQEKARWEYLAAQMYEARGQFDQARTLYARSLDHNIDPAMDMYARLNLVHLTKSEDDHFIDRNIADLIRMAKKDKYADYRSMIYFMAARMELERNHLDAARNLLVLGAKYNNDPASHNSSFLQIADLSYDQKKYAMAAAFYDSLKLGTLDPDVARRVTDRKAMLAKVTAYSGTISRQDSLQRIATMPDDERTAFLNKMLKKQRRDLKKPSDNVITGGSASSLAAADLFSSQPQPKGEWYFYNTNAKAQGYTQFKQTWGNRPNTDNWRRFTDVSMQLQAKIPNNTRPVNPAEMAGSDAAEPSMALLLAKLPMDPASMIRSNDSIRTALFNLGSTYLNDIEDYPSAVETFEQLRKRFPDYPRKDELLFQMNRAYAKAGNLTAAEEAKTELTQKYPASRYASILSSGKDPLAVARVSPAATKDYEAVYEMYMEGKFDEAEAAKNRADSTYKTNYWEPQLLYIEAVYQIRQRNDSVAQKILHTLIGQNPNTPLASKAQNLSQVLARRRQIEEELNRLQIQTPAADSTVKTQPLVVQAPPAKTQSDTVRTIAKNTTVLATNPRFVSAQEGKLRPNLPVDTSMRRPLVQQKAASVYRFDPGSRHYAMIILDKVDVIFGNEAKNAFFRYNKESFYNQTLDINAVDLDTDHKVLLVGDFSNAQDALDYALKAKKLAASEIIPWLKADKYSFSIISAPNLDVLKTSPDLAVYKKFLDQNLPGKF
jgi:TolA-binding protein